MSYEERIRSALASRAADTRARDDGWSEVQRRLDGAPSSSEPPGLAVGQRVAAAIVAVVVFGGAVALMAGAFDRDTSGAVDENTLSEGTASQSSWDPTAYERTRELEDMELLQALGAVPVEFVPGQDRGTWQQGGYLKVNGSEVPGCPASGAPEYVLIGMGDGTFYCVGVRDSDEAFDIGRRASPLLEPERQPTE